MRISHEEHLKLEYLNNQIKSGKGIYVTRRSDVKKLEVIEFHENNFVTILDPALGMKKRARYGVNEALYLDDAQFDEFISDLELRRYKEEYRLLNSTLGIIRRRELDWKTSIRAGDYVRINDPHVSDILSDEGGLVYVIKILPQDDIMRFSGYTVKKGAIYSGVFDCWKYVKIEHKQLGN